MNTSAAIVIAAALIGGCVVWAGQIIGRDATCAGYLSSSGGADALYVVARLRDKPRAGTMAADFLESLRLARCQVVEG